MTGLSSDGCLWGMSMKKLEKLAPNIKALGSIMIMDLLCEDGS